MTLIEQQKALDAIEKCHKRCCRTDSNGDEWIHYETTLNEIESIKPKQEIIHCKDCKYSIDEYNDGDCYCKRPSRELVWIGKSWDFFCKAGDKRGGEAE